MSPLLFLGLLVVPCYAQSDLALFALDVDGLRAEASEPVQFYPRFKRQSSVSYRVNHYEVGGREDQQGHESQAAHVGQPGSKAVRGPRQLGITPRYVLPNSQQHQPQPQQGAPDYLDFYQQYGLAADAQQPQYYGSLAHYAAEQQQAAGQPPTTTLSPLVREQIRLQQEYKDRPIKEQERLALGLRRPPQILPGQPAPPQGKGYFVPSGQALVNSVPQYYQEERSQPQYYGREASGEQQYYQSPPLFTSADEDKPVFDTKLLSPTGKSLGRDPTQSFSYAQLQFGESAPGSAVGYNTKINNLRQKLSPQPEQHVSQRSTLKQRQKPDPNLVYETASYQIESSTPNAIPHYISPTPKSQYISQTQHQNQYYQLVPSATPNVVYQSQGANGLIQRPSNPKVESSTIKPQHQVVYTVQPQYVTTPEYQQVYQSTASPQVQYVYEPKQQIQRGKSPKLIVPEYITAPGQQQIPQYQQIQQLQQLQAQNYENQGIEFDQDLFASIYSQPNKGFYANIKKPVGHGANPSSNPAYNLAPSKSAIFVTTAAPSAIRESALSPSEDYQFYKNTETNELSIQTPDGRKPLSPTEIKALADAGFQIPDVKAQPEAVHVRAKPVYSYQPVAVPAQTVRSSTTEIPAYVTRQQVVSSTYPGSYVSTPSPYSNLQETSETEGTSRQPEPRFKSRGGSGQRKRVPSPVTLTEDERQTLSRQGIRNVYKVETNDNQSAPATYVLALDNGSTSSDSTSRGLSKFTDSRLVTRSTSQTKNTEKTR